MGVSKMELKMPSDIGTTAQLRLEALNMSIIATNTLVACNEERQVTEDEILSLASRFEDYLKTGNTKLKKDNDNKKKSSGYAN